MTENKNKKAVGRKEASVGLNVRPSGTHVQVLDRHRKVVAYLPMSVRDLDFVGRVAFYSAYEVDALLKAMGLRTEPYDM